MGKPSFNQNHQRYCIACIWPLKDTDFLGDALSLSYCNNEECARYGLYTHEILYLWDEEQFNMALAARKSTKKAEE